MSRQFFLARAQHQAACATGRQALDRTGLQTPAGSRLAAVAGQRQMGLTAGHRQVHVGENLGVEQGAVQLAPRVVHTVTLAQRIQVVALPRMPFARHQQGIEDRAVLGQVGALGLGQQGEFVVEEADIERRVVDDQLRIPDEVEEFIGHVLEARLANEVLVPDPVHGDRAFVDLAVRLQVDVEMPPGRAPADQLDTADFDDAVPVGDRHASGFGV